MPEVFPVNAVTFQNLLRDLQIVAAPRVPVWWLSDTIQPVALVNSQVTLNALVDQSAMQFATNGIVAAPAANALLADTGALDAGRYLFRVFIGWSDGTLNQQIQLRQRNAANAADIWVFEYGSFLANNANFVKEWVQDIAQDERLLVQVMIVSGGGRYNAIIWRTFLS